MPEILETNVKIKADASSLKKETNDSINALEKLQEKFEEVSEALSKAFSQNGKADYIASLTEQRNELMRLINDLKSGVIDASDSAIQKVLGGIDAAPVEEVKKEVKEVNNELENVEKTQNRINNNWDTSGIKSLVKNIKRIGASLIGVTTVFSLIRKSMNTYLSQNEELKNKLNAIYYALGSMFAPILEWLITLFAKIVLYVNAFLRGLGFAGIQFKKIENSSKKTQKAVKRTKDLISGFDELNVYTKNSEEAAEDLDEAADAFQDPFESVEVNQEWIQKLYELGEKLRPIVEAIWNLLKTVFDWVLDHIELVIAGLVAIKGIGLLANIMQIAQALKPIWTLISNIGTAIKTALASSALTPILTTIAGILSIITGLSAAVLGFVNMWKNGWNIIDEIIKDLGIALAAVGAIMLGAPAAIAGIVAAIVAIVSSLVIVIKDHWSEIKVWLENCWTKIKEIAETLWNGICDTITRILNAFAIAFNAIWEGIKNTLSNLWTALSNLATNIWTGISNTIRTLMSALNSFLTSMWMGIKNTAVNAWNGIREGVTSVLTGIKDFALGVWTNIKDGVVSMNQIMANAISSIWNGIIGVIKGAINGILGFINGLVKGIVNGLNSVIGVLNRFKVTVPSWVPSIGGRSFGFNVPTLSAPQIPLLAKGGVINSPTMAMMGEYAGAGNNPEIAAPQSLIREMLQENNGELVSAFAQMTQQIISAINNVDMEVSIGDDVIAQSASRGNRQYYNMTGRELISV